MLDQILKSPIEEIKFYLDCGCDPNIQIALFDENSTFKKKIGTIDIILKYFYYRPNKEWTRIFSLLIQAGVSLDYTFYKDFQENVDCTIQKQIYNLKQKRHLLLLFY